MLKDILISAMFAMLSMGGVSQSPEPALNDAQIAHIAYTAGKIDIEAAKQALEKATDKDVRSFAETMLRDHQAVNEQALALVGRLGVTPEANSTSAALTQQAAERHEHLATLSGPEFDAAYVQNEVAYHRTVNDALRTALIPAAQNPELKALLESGLALFGAHQMHAEQLVKLQE